MKEPNWHLKRNTKSDQVKTEKKLYFPLNRCSTVRADTMSDGLKIKGMIQHMVLL